MEQKKQNKFKPLNNHCQWITHLEHMIEHNFQIDFACHKKVNLLVLRAAERIASATSRAI